jgi:hypothetical protein
MINFFKKIFGDSADITKSVERIPLPQTEEEKEVFMKRYLETLIKHGWVMDPSASASSADKATGDLAVLDPDLLKFLLSFKTLGNDSEDAWFVELGTQPDNLAPWENHLFIMESSVIEDSTISVILQGEDKGKFIYCNEDIHEDAEVVADDFFSFLQLHAYCVELGKDIIKNNQLWPFV